MMRNRQMVHYTDKHHQRKEDKNETYQIRDYWMIQSLLLWLWFAQF